MLITLKDMMGIAEKEKIAIGGFNTPNLASLEAVIGAAEEEKLPVILMFAECHAECGKAGNCPRLCSPGSRRTFGVFEKSARAWFYGDYV